MRLFLAAELPVPVREELARAVDRLRTPGADVRWVAPGNLHLTLKFCGELEDPAALAREVEVECRGLGAVDLEVAGIGRFPDRGPARVIWAGCLGDVAPVAAACDRAARRLGVPRDEHAFTAHITVGRARQGCDSRALGDAIRTYSSANFGSFRLEAVTLFRSDLRPEGPLYAAVNRISLAAKP